MVTASSSRRRVLAVAGATLGFGVGLGLGGCAGGDAMVVAPARSGADELLMPWLTLGGGWRVDPQQLPQAAPIAGGRLNFIAPVGVAALGEVLLVADAGARTLWRLDRGRDTMSALAPFTGGSPDQGASLQLGNDFSAWVALPAQHMVVQYDARGRVLRRWSDEADAARPVAVAVPDDRAVVLVGDAATARIVVFDPLGRARGLLGAGALQSVTALAWSPRGLYVLDRLAQQVVVLGSGGEVLEVIGEHALVRPRALAVDRSGRVFVSDDADQRIKVFRGPRQLASAGGAGAGPGRFGRIEALALDGNLLYVADSLNARVQVLLVTPPSMERVGAAP